MARESRQAFPTLPGWLLDREEARRLLARRLGTQGLENVARIGSSKVLFGQKARSRRSDRRHFPSFNWLTGLPQDEGPPTHSHDVPELGTVLKGELNAVVGQTLYEVREGDWLIIRPGIRHGEFCLESRASYGMMWFVFWPGLYALATTHYTRAGGYKCEAFQAARYEASELDLSVADIFHEPLPPVETLRSKLAGLASWWLRVLLEAKDRPLSQSRPLLERIRPILENAAGRPPSVAELAQRVGLSVSHLSRLFHAQAGRTLSRFIQDNRIARAQRYLLESSLTTKEIANLLGFADSQHFSHALRRLTGATPTQFRLGAPRKNRHEIAERDN